MFCYGLRRIEPQPQVVAAKIFPHALNMKMVHAYGCGQVWSQLTRKFVCGPWAMGLCRCPPPPFNVGKSDGSTSDFFLGSCLGFVGFNFEGGCGRNNDQGVLTIFWLIVTGVVSKSVLPQTHKMQIFRGTRPSLSQTGAGSL